MKCSVFLSSKRRRVNFHSLFLSLDDYLKAAEVNRFVFVNKDGDSCVRQLFSHGVGCNKVRLPLKTNRDMHKPVRHVMVQKRIWYRQSTFL